MFELFKKSKKIDLFDIACDYDGYDIVFEKDFTDINIYVDFNNIITNNRYDIMKLLEYQTFKTTSTEESFDMFYDAWKNTLINKGFLFHLDVYVSMKQFTEGINRILISIGCEKQLNVSTMVRAYQEELLNYSLQGKEILGEINYDILQCNVVARELRLIGYELICLFNGFDNNDKSIVPIDKIDELKRLEEKI